MLDTSTGAEDDLRL